jgi:hypothetical protein
MNKVFEATVEYLLRKERYSHPDGKSDKSRWYPSDTERKICCNSIRSPSRAYPWSLMTHCRSIEHVAMLYGVDKTEIKECLKKKNLPLLLGFNKTIDKIISKKLGADQCSLKDILTASSSAS